MQPEPPAPIPPIPPLKTATGIADPVLIRLSTPAMHILLLGEHLTYDRAGMMRLEAVRCHIAPRGWKAIFRRKPNPSLHARVALRRLDRRIFAAIPGMTTLRVRDHSRSFTLTNLSHPQFEALSNASARRLLQAARRRRISLLASALWAAHRLRFTLPRAMLPAMFR